MVHKKGRMIGIWQHGMSGVSLEQEHSDI